MIMTIYKNADDFLEDNKGIMEEHSIAANLIWVNALSHKTVEDGFFGASIAAEDSAYLAIMTSPHPMVHFSVGDDTEPLAELLAKYLSANHMLPDKINGQKQASILFKDMANELGAGYEESRYLYLMECKKVNDIKIVNGNYQSPIIVDFDFAPWHLNFHTDCAIDGKADYEFSKAKTRKMIKNGNLVCYLVDGNPVTMAAKTRVVSGGRCIGTVYTPKDLRGKGYSTACIKHLTQEILNEGNECAYLYADKYNPASNHVYEKIGYEVIGDFIEYCRG
ncbi:MAG: GNAT family N-acetyltransferase [Clostridiales bacterium]|nr:GNAT family N-acetyltransferase [Clostridiales bacterium]